MNLKSPFFKLGKVGALEFSCGLLQTYSNLSVNEEIQVLKLGSLDELAKVGPAFQKTFLVVVKMKGPYLPANRIPSVDSSARFHVLLLTAEDWLKVSKK